MAATLYSERSERLHPLQLAQRAILRVQHEFNGSPDDRPLRMGADQVSMAMKYRLLVLALACTLLACVAAYARKPPHSAPPESAQPNPTSLEQAVKQVQHQTGGHILAADTVSRGKANVYRIKVLTPKGQVRVVQMHSSARSQSKPGKSDSDQGGH